MTLADLHAAVTGYVTAHTGKTEDTISTDEAVAALAEEMAAGRAHRG